MSDEIGEPERTDIQRDSNFVRATADTALVSFLGRDVEIAFIQESVDPAVLIETENEGNSYEMRGSVVEVCRVRLAPGKGVVLALSILDELASTGRVNAEALEKAAAKILMKARGQDVHNKDEAEA